MSKHNGRDYLTIVWKDVNSGSRFEIGQLSKNGCYEFIYIKKNLDKAQKKGFEAFVAFPDFDKKYSNNDVFPAFSSRLPDKRRKDISVILSKYNLEEYNAFELLRRSGGKLPTDSLEFIDPIFLENDEAIVREFYIAGTRYSSLCLAESYPDCIVNFELNTGEALILTREPDNEHDHCAIGIYKDSEKREKIGFVPAYYSEAVSDAINSNRKIQCLIKQFNQENCQECVKVVLEIKKK